jgi:hypothetical protein
MKFKERYEHLQAAAAPAGTPPRPTKKQKTHTLLRDLNSDDSDSDNAHDDQASSTPWLVEYEQYMDTNDIIPPGMTVVAWWGVRYVLELYSPSSCQ